jgi:protein-S-isoprenylcysteine O-methyltransferase Ste14
MSEEETTLTSYTWKRDPLLWAYSLLMLLPIILVFIFYNYYSLDFLFYTGWVLLIFGIVIIFLAGGEFRRRGGAPEGESIVQTTVLVDSGVYGIIRHPQYLGFMSIVFSMVLMSQHWLSLISAFAGCILFYIDVQREEQNSIKKFGVKYERYMERVPGFNILLGALRIMRHTKQSQKDDYSESFKE